MRVDERSGGILSGESKEVERNMLRRLVGLGAVLLIVLGVAHAVHVGRSDDVEPYLWAASIFLVVQGILTLVFVKRS